MSYDKTNWKTGDVITAEKLNKIERCIGGDEHTVSVTQLDLMTLYTCIIATNPNPVVINGVNSSGDGVFEFKPSDFADHSIPDCLMTEPAKSINVGEDLNTITIYFIARPDFEGITINGQKVEFSEYAPEMFRHIDADGITMTRAIINGSSEDGYTMSASKLCNVLFS